MKKYAPLVLLIVASCSNAASYTPGAAYAPIVPRGPYKEVLVDHWCGAFEKGTRYLISGILQPVNTQKYGTMFGVRVYLALETTRYRTLAGGENITSKQHYGFENYTHVVDFDEESQQGCVEVKVVFASTAAQYGDRAQYWIRSPLSVSILQKASGNGKGNE